MPSQKAKSGHKPNLAAKATRARYNLNRQRDKNKIIRVARSNGAEAARQYAADRGLLMWAKSVGLV